MAIIELINLYPRWSIIIIAVVLSLFISLINYFVLDKEKMKGMKARQKEIQKEMKEHKQDQAKQTELSKELLSHTMENMKHSFKPMLITIIPILVVFWWIKGVYAETAIASSWFWWYLGAAIASSLIFRKLFKLP
jgi:uncharacterized membrane protein (DUF106 family)